MMGVDIMRGRLLGFLLFTIPPLYFALVDITILTTLDLTLFRGPDVSS